MRKIALIVAAVVMFGGAASAADLPAPIYTKAPPPLPVVYNWTGFYVGLNAGGAGIQKDDAVLSLPPGPPQAFGFTLANGGIPLNYGTRGSSFLYGTQAGYNWQVDNFVLGAEADLFGVPTRLRRIKRRTWLPSLLPLG